MNTSKKLLHLALLPGFFFQVHADETYLARFQNPDKSAVSQFFKEGRDVAAYIPGKHVDLVVSEAEYRGLAAKYPRAAVLQTSSRAHATLRGCRGYLTYEQMLDKLRSFENAYPQLCKLYDIGDSRGKEYNGTEYKAYDGYKHELWAMKITGDVSRNADKPKFYFMGEHHAREPASMDVCVAILEHFLLKYSSDAAVADRVNNCELWFVPLVNPNGHKLVFSHEDYSFWRKNIRDNNNDRQISLDNQGWGDSGDGVDLNRNYEYQWGTTGIEKDPLDPSYPGPSHWSEPEIKAIRTLMSENMFVAGLSYHLYSELVLWPYGHKENAYAPDSAALGDLGRKIAGRLPKVGGGTYTPEKASDLYPASGTSDDFAYSSRGTFAYTIELFDSDFYPDDSQVEKLKKDNIVAAMELVNRVKYSTLTGTVTSGGTSPIEAEVYVKEIDDTVANKTSWRGPYMTDKAYGRYYRLLLPGLYTVTIKPKNPACKDTTIAGVTISGDRATTLNIAYGGTPVLSMSGHGADTRGILVETLPGKRLRIVFTAGDAGRSVSLFSADGAFVMKLPRSSARTHDVTEWNMKQMARGLYLLRITGAKRCGTARFVLTD